MFCTARLFAAFVMTLSMSSKFSMRVEEGAVILNGHGSGHRDVRIALDGSITEIKEPKTISRYRGAWKDGTFEYQTEFVPVSDNARTLVLRKEFRMTKDGLLVRVNTGTSADSGRSRFTSTPRTSRCPRRRRPRLPTWRGWLERGLERGVRRGRRRSRSDGARRSAARCSPCRARSTRAAR